MERIEFNVPTLALHVGRAAALHYPDQPWAHWHYVDGRNNFVFIHNSPEFLHAAGTACRAVGGYLGGREDSEMQPAMPENVKEAPSIFIRKRRLSALS
jgi:hypothetical protein